MKIKIQDKKILDDGQVIYVLGGIRAPEFNKFANDIGENVFVCEWDNQAYAHRVMRSVIKHHLPSLVKWLKENDAETTCWVDLKILETITDIYSEFSWGIGFRLNDPIETWFVLRWS